MSPLSRSDRARYRRIRRPRLESLEPRRLLAVSLTITTSSTVASLGGSASFQVSETGGTGTGDFVVDMDGVTGGPTAEGTGGRASVSVSPLPNPGHTTVTLDYYSDASLQTLLGSTTLAGGFDVVTGGITLTSSANPSAINESVTYTVSLPGPSAGTITLADNTTSAVLGTANISGQSSVSFSSSALGQGFHDVGASFSPGGPGVSYGILAGGQNVEAATTTALTSTPSAPLYGQTVSLTAQVSVVAPGTGTPTGMVTFYDGSTNLGTSLIAGGFATDAIASPAVGAHSYRAVYSGAAGFAPSSGPTSGSNTIATFAGNGTAGFSGDGGAATSAELNGPNDAITNAVGDVFIADQAGNRIREVFPNGNITTIAGNGTAGFSGDGGPATAAQLSAPANLVLDSFGDLYFSDLGNSRVREILTTGLIQTVATAAADGIGQPGGLALDASGNLYVDNYLNSEIIKITPTGAHSVYAGNGTAGFSGDGGAATSAELNDPIGLAINSAGDLFIADRLNQRVREVLPSGTIQTIAGNGTAGSTGDGGLATSAELNGPHGLALDSAGDLFLTEAQGNRVREILTSGIIQTVAGTGTAGFAGDGGPAASGELSQPTGLSVDPSGNILVADDSNNRVRVIHPGLAVTVQPSPTTTVVSFTPSSISYGQSVQLTATVTPTVTGSGTPTGTVTFTQGAVNLGTVALNPQGVASLVLNNLPGGSDAITASYSGATNDAPSVGSNTLTVIPISTTTTVSSSINPVILGNSVTYTANVSDGVPADTPDFNGGLVTFLDGSTTIGTVTVSGGSAALATTPSTIGSHAITARYAPPNGNSTASTSSALSEVVQPVPTTLSVIVPLSPVSFTTPLSVGARLLTAPGATIAGEPITFTSGTTTLGTATTNANGIALLSGITTLPVGTDPIVASFAGDSTYAPVTASSSVTIDAISTTTTLTAAPNPVVDGGSVTLTATVLASPSSGQSYVNGGIVTFLDGSTVLGTATVTGGTAAINVTESSPGIHATTASYAPPDGNSTASTSSAVNENVLAPSQTTLVSGPNPTSYGQTVTFTATVAFASGPGVTGSSGTPTGQVIFLVDDAPVATVGLDSSGTATYATTTLLASTHTITAEYQGDAVYAPSGSAAVSQTVTVAATTTTLGPASPASITLGQTSTLTATVAYASPTPGNPAGLVDFLDGSTLLGQADVGEGGVATFTTSTLNVGPHFLTAEYAGVSGQTTSSTSGVQRLVVTAPGLQVRQSVDSTIFGQPVILTANQAGGPLSGTVTFYDLGATSETLIGTANLVNGSMTSFTETSLAVGTHQVAAFFELNGASAPLTYNLAPTTLTILPQPITDLSVNTSVPFTPALLGQPRTYTITVTNLGPDPATGVTLTNALPANATFVAASAGSVVSGSLIDPIGNLGSGQSVVITLTLRPTSTGTLINTASVNTSVDLDPTFANNTSTTTTPVLPAADLAVALSPDAGLDRVGFPLTETLTITNLGPSDATSVVTTVTLPSSFANVNILPDQGGFTISGNLVTILSGTIAAGGASTIIITATPTAAGLFQTTATTGSSIADTNASNNTASLGVTILPEATSTVVLVLPNPSAFEQPVTFTAIVTPAGAGLPTGSVGFYDDTNPASPMFLGSAPVDASGQASLTTTTSLGVGSHAISARYSGDANNLASASPDDSLRIDEPTTTTLAVDPSPSVFGQPVNIIANVGTVTPGAGVPTGVVTLLDNGAPLASGSLVAGSATFTLGSLATGSHVFQIQYVGNLDFLSSFSDLVTSSVNRAGVSLTVSVPTGLVSGQTTAVSASVAVVSPGAGVPTGLVAFFDGVTPLGQAPLVGGVANLGGLSFLAGTHAITATYLGDASFAPGSSSGSPIVVQQASLSAGLSVSVASPVAGQDLTITANLAALAPGSGTPTGTVTFLDGATLLGQGPLVAGVATLAGVTFPAGTHSLSIIYSGDSNFLATISPAPLVLSVARASSVVQLLGFARTPSGATTPLVPAPRVAPVAGQALQFSGGVSTSAPGSGVPTGTVQVLDGSTLLATVSLDSSGQYQLITSKLTVGAHVITVQYLGDANTLPRFSSSLTLTVTQASTTTTVIASSSFLTLGQPVTLQANVQLVGPSAGVPVGQVQFYSNNQPIGIPTPLDPSGSAAIVVALPLGQNVITALYSDPKLQDHSSQSAPGMISVLTSVGGTGQAGSTGDGKLATQATFNQPTGVAVDGSGNLFIADTGNNRIREIFAASGIIRTVPGTSTPGAFLNPTAVAIDAQGNLYVADTGNNRIREVFADGTITTILGDGARTVGDGGTPIPLLAPKGLAIDAQGNLFVSDTGHNRVLEILAAGGSGAGSVVTTLSLGATPTSAFRVVATVAGTGEAGVGPDGALALATPLNAPRGLTLDAAGNLYIADTGNNRVVKVISTRGSDAPGSGSAPPGSVVTVAGTLPPGSPIDGTPIPLQAPSDVAIDRSGNLYISNTNSDQIVELGAQGQVDRISVVGSISVPTGITATTAGTVVFANTGTNQIFAVTDTQLPDASAGAAIVDVALPGAVELASSSAAATLGTQLLPLGTTSLEIVATITVATLEISEGASAESSPAPPRPNQPTTPTAATTGGNATDPSEAPRERASAPLSGPQSLIRYLLGIDQPITPPSTETPDSAPAPEGLPPSTARPPAPEPTSPAEVPIKTSKAPREPAKPIAPNAGPALVVLGAILATQIPRDRAGSRRRPRTFSPLPLEERIRG
jgi:uncharacterized repeat protein (TIGR01451 family)